MKIIFSCIIFICFTHSALAKVQLTHIDPQDIEKLNKAYPNLNSQAVSLSTLDKAIKFLMGLGNYAQVWAEKDKNNNYTIGTYKLKKVGAISVFGNKNASTDDVLFILGLKPGSKFDSGRMIDAGEKLKEYYGQKGFFNAIISFDFTETSNNILNIKVLIRERDPCLIESIIVQSDNSELNHQLERKNKKYIKTNFTESSVLNIENTVTEYLIKNKYLNSQLLQKSAKYNSTKTRVSLTYEVTDPFIYEVYMEGNLFKNSLAILNYIGVDNLTKGSVDLGQDITLAIRSYYLANGFAHARINYTSKTIESKFIKKLFIEIIENKKIIIKQFEIAGRISKPASYYIDFIKENSSDIIDNRIYVKSDLDIGYKNLITHLNNQGYLNAKIISSRAEYNDTKDSVIISVTIDEGPLTMLTKINFVGLSAFTREEILKILDIKMNMPLRLNEIESSIQKLNNFYFNRGYIEMRILNPNDALISYDNNGLSASINFNIKEGPQVYIKSVSIEGNTFTKDYVIFREAGIDVGDLVTPELLEETQKRLDKLAIFSRVELRTLEVGTEISQRTLVIYVTERNPGLFKFGAGLTNKREITARGFAGVSYNNINGKARAVSLNGTVENNIKIENYLEYEAGLSYLEPFLFNKRLRGRASYTRSEKITESTDSTTDANLSATDSIKFILEKDITSKIKLSWLAWGFDSVEQFNLPESGPKDRESRQEIAYIGPSIDLDYTDNIFLPTKGHYTKLDTEYASPDLGSSDGIDFFRIQGVFTLYKRIAKSQYIWANSFRSGYVENLSSELNSGVPSSFAFFLGGYTSLRGYTGAANDRLPNVIEFPVDDSNQLIIPKSSTFYLFKSEVRFPLWTEPFAGAIFYDAGRVEIDGCKENRTCPNYKDDFRQVAGLGVRINTPVGAISLDYGRKLNPRKYSNGSGDVVRESPDQWHLSIGTF